jgi:2-dehydro-3-deoxygluconokinase
VKIAFVGECMIELRQDPSSGLTLGYAGDTLNAAVYCRRQLGNDPITVDYVTALGHDRYSDAMLEFWRREGLGCNNVRRIAGKQCGLYAINVDASGERSFTYWRNDSAARQMFAGADGERLLQQLAGYDGVYLSGITLAILAEDTRDKLWSALEQLKSNHGRLYFDTNFRPALWPDKADASKHYERMLHLCDIAFLTREDEQLLFDTPTVEAILTRCAAFATPELVVKNGGDPCWIRHGGNLTSVPASKPDRVVDTTAAGDAFSAAYLAARLLGKSPEASALEAHKLAAHVISFSGAFESQ